MPNEWITALPRELFSMSAEHNMDLLFINPSKVTFTGWFGATLQPNGGYHDAHLEMDPPYSSAALKLGEEVPFQVPDVIDAA